jgi:hypothetical protein
VGFAVYEGMIVTLLEDAHSASWDNEKVVAKSDMVGCFYCCKVYKAAKIINWTGGTKCALCVECKVDSIIPDASGYPLHPVFLGFMAMYWFGRIPKGVM